jgi:hypothetical protein
MTNLDMRPEPFDPNCGQYARDMVYLDTFIFESQQDFEANGPATPEMRVNYVRREEGTFNPANGHFLCDACYIAAGQPSSRNGWTCP